MTFNYPVNQSYAYSEPPDVDIQYYYTPAVGEQPKPGAVALAWTSLNNLGGIILYRETDFSITSNCSGGYTLCVTPGSQGTIFLVGLTEYIGFGSFSFRISVNRIGNGYSPYSATLMPGPLFLSRPTTTTTAPPPAPVFNTGSFSLIANTTIRNQLTQAANRWMQNLRVSGANTNYIRNFRPDWNGIELVDFQAVNDPTDNWIASCAVVSETGPIGNNPIKRTSVEFDIWINTAFWKNYSNAQKIVILVHELGHAIGIGTLWTNIEVSENGLIDNPFLLRETQPNTYNLYEKAVRKYCQCAFPNVNLNMEPWPRTKIPLENTGGAGTSSAHWEDLFRPASTAPFGDRDSYPGLSNDIMGGYFDTAINYIISSITIQNLADMGYEAINPEGEGCPTFARGAQFSVSNIEDSSKIKLNCSRPNPKPTKIITLGPES